MDTVIRKNRILPQGRLEGREQIGVDAVFMAVWFLWCFFIRMSPINIPIPEKETHVAGLLVLYFLNRKKIRFNKRFLWVLVGLMAYYLLLTLWKEGTNFGLIPLSMLSWWACLLVGTCVDWNAREIKLFMETIKWSCLICSVSIALRNEPFSGASELVIFGITMNRNWLIDVSLPGLIIQLFQMVMAKKVKFFNWVIAAILFYACILPISRGEFLSMVLCAGLIGFYKFRGRMKVWSSQKTMLMVIGVGILILLLYSVVPQSYTDRLWNPNNYNSENSDRVDRWIDGIEMVDDPIFGMGPTYYERNTDYAWKAYGVHNMFVDLYIASGLIGAGLAIWLFACFFRWDALALSLFVYAFMRVFVEAGRTPGTWEILTILAALYGLSDARGVSVSELLKSIYSQPESEEAKGEIRTCIRARQRSWI